MFLRLPKDGWRLASTSSGWRSLCFWWAEGLPGTVIRQDTIVAVSAVFLASLTQCMTGSPAAKRVLFFFLTVLQQHLVTLISSVRWTVSWRVLGTALVMTERKQEKPNSSNESKQH
ncbi:unnamed protein product [Effrenium voratum]|uniref:Uncharacterized protein n=1 Tax=Effrenium voratum TaxID=2562239 RepID=A0AA36IKV4_9DINO|nr:unnamed protein product [Effrenium voratum]